MSLDMGLGGWTLAFIYIKASATYHKRFYEGSFDRFEALPHTHSLTLCGLPRHKRAFHRKMKRRRDDNVDQTKLLN